MRAVLCTLNLPGDKSEWREGYVMTYTAFSGGGGGVGEGLNFGLGERHLEFCNIVTTIVITNFAKKA